MVTTVHRNLGHFHRKFKIVLSILEQRVAHLKIFTKQNIFRIALAHHLSGSLLSSGNSEHHPKAALRATGFPKICTQPALDS